MTSDEPDTGTARRRLGVGAAIVVVVVALAVTVGIGILRGASAPTESVPVVIDETTAPAAATDALHVHVSGAVATPGLYVLPADSRVVDAVGAAGGFADDADRDAVNLARQLGDGEQIVVARIGEAPVQGSGDPAGDGLIDLNTADEAQLDTLPRIGPAMAARIIEWRETNGRFTSVEDLLAVPGIGDKMLASLRDLVRV